MITKEELEQWYKLLQGETASRQLGFCAPIDEHRELTRLNHLVMEASHKIHNDNMMEVER